MPVRPLTVGIQVRLTDLPLLPVLLQDTLELRLGLGHGLLRDVGNDDHLGVVNPELGEQVAEVDGAAVKVLRPVGQGEYAQLAPVELPSSLQGT